MGAGAGPAPGQAKVLGFAQGARQAAVAAQGSLPSASPAGAGFRAKWESLLASLGGDAEGGNGTEAAAESGEVSVGSTGSPEENAAASFSRPASATASGAELRLQPGTRRQGGESGAAQQLTLAEARAGNLSAGTASATTLPETSGAEEGKTTAETEGSDSTSRTRSALTAKPAKARATTAEAASGVMPAALSVPSQVAPSLASASTAAGGTGEETQSARTVPSTDPTDRATSLAGSLAREDVPGAAGSAKGDLAGSVPAATTSSSREQVSQSGSSSSVLEQTESLSAHAGASAAAAADGEDSAPSLDNEWEYALAAGRGMTEILPLSQTTGQTEQAEQTLRTDRARSKAASQSAIQASTPPQTAAGTLPQSQSSFPASAAAQTPTSASLSGLNPAVAAAGHNQAQAQATSQDADAAAATAGSGSAAQTTAQPLDPALDSTQIVSPNQQPATTLGDNGLNRSPFAASLAASQASSAAAPAAAAGTTGSNGGEAAAASAAQPVRGGVASARVQQQKVSAEGDSSDVLPDASAVIRSVAGARAAAGEAGDRAGEKTDEAAGTTPGDTFAALDAASGAEKSVWIHADAHQAEAGFEDPSLGWVGVRADTSGGGIHAELVAGSSDAAQALSSHMEGLNEYLTEQHTPVATLTLSSPGGWSGAGGGQSSGQNGEQQTQQGTEQQTAQTAALSFSSSLSGTTTGSRTAQAAAAAALSGWSAGQDGSAAAAGLGGTYISVMA